MDVLGDILSTLELRSTMYFRAELTAPFSIAVPPDPNVIRFHVASEGPCHITLPSGESGTFLAGDLALVPHGAAHVLSDSRAETAVPLPDVLHRSGFNGSGPLVFGGGGSRTVIVCGYFGFAPEAIHPVVESLPPLIILKADAARHYGWLERLIEQMDMESRARGSAWGEIVRRLSEILFLYVLREYAGANPSSTGALMALGDSRIGRALQAIHRDPAADWSVEDLAAKAALSRSAFAEQFREKLGTTPTRYLAAWRMHKARYLIRNTGKSAQEIALEVGYESESAFNRAFREHFGEPPGRFRRAGA
jgi:AraC family transcriptional activator of mtrCDE